MRFTVQSLNSLAGRPKEYLVFDDRSTRTGGRLAVRVRAGGADTRREFLFVYRQHGRRRKLSLGEFGDSSQGKLSLREANEQYENLSALVRSGKDPIAERHALAAADKATRLEARRQGTFRHLAEAYVASLRGRDARSAGEIARSIEHDAYPIIGESKLAKHVTAQDVRLAMRRVVTRGSREQANRLRRYLQTAFKFGLEHDQRVDVTEASELLFGIEHNPARDVPQVKRPGESGIRDIELTSSEIATLWRTLDVREVPADPASPPVLHQSCVAALRLLLATGGQRVEVVLQAKWNEFDFEQELWTVPLARRKNRRHARGAHLVPLNSLAVDTVQAQHAREPGAYLFPPLGKRGKSSSLRADTLCGYLKHWIDATKFPKEFAPRDLRQTWKARAGELGLSKEIRDRIQDHTLSDVSSKHYDSYDYVREKRQAMDAWDKRLRSIIAGDNVVPIRAAS